MRNKKISLPIFITILALFGTICFVSAYFLAYGSVSSKVNDLNQRTDMFAKLRDVDTAVRQNYFNKIDEEKLINSLINGYVNGLDTDDVVLITPSEAEGKTYQDTNETKVVYLFDGYILIFKKTPID